MSTSRFDDFYRGRRVLVTGHTGFKGAWMAVWLRLLGAEVVGYSLEPDDAQQFLFDGARVADGTTSLEGDVRELDHLSRVCQEYSPEIVFHLAAQSLVRRSYQDPVTTNATNIMGTVNVLEAARHTATVQAVVVVTTDKVYENREWVHPYRESDRLGGHDPYSSSKAAAEIVTASYRQAFDSGAGLATARAGNVIGGGDFSADRLLPDCVRALQAGEVILVRNPGSVRPWQHVLEPLSGYLALAASLAGDRSAFDGAWNFGPSVEGHMRVGEIVDIAVREWGSGSWKDVSDPDAPHEAATLMLDCTKAIKTLGWRPIWSTPQALAETLGWYRAVGNGEDPRLLMEEQIGRYVEAGSQMNLAWAG